MRTLREHSPVVTTASPHQTVAERRSQLTRWFASVTLGIAAFSGPYSYIHGRIRNSVWIAVCSLLLLGVRVWIERRPQSSIPPLVVTVACQVGVMLGMWNSGGVESAAIMWIPVTLLLAALLLEARQAMVLFVLCLAGMMTIA